jgi:hypothetical protein
MEGSMELKRAIVIILLTCGILGAISYWAFHIPAQKQNFFAYAENGTSLGVYWYQNGSSPVTNIDWGYVSEGTENVTIYAKNEGNTSFYVYTVQQEWIPRNLSGTLNLYGVPKTQQINVNETKNMTLCLSLKPSFGEDVNFTGNTILYAVSDLVLLPDKENFSELWVYNLNLQLAMHDDPYIVESGIFNVTTLSWTPKASWFAWGIIPSSRLSLTLQGNYSGILKVSWIDMASNVKLAFSNGTKLNAVNFWNSTTKQIALGLTINDGLSLSIYPEEMPSWYSWAWLIPSLTVAFAVILKHIKNPYAKLLTLTTIEDGFLRISLILIRMPLLICVPISIVLDIIAHSVRQPRNVKRRFLLALGYNSAWYGLYFVGSLWHWSLGILLGVLFHFTLDMIIIKRSGVALKEE